MTVAGREAWDALRAGHERPTAKPDTRERAPSGQAVARFGVQCFCRPTRKPLTLSTRPRAWRHLRSGNERVGPSLLAHLSHRQSSGLRQQRCSMVKSASDPRSGLFAHPCFWPDRDFLRAGLVSFLCVFEHRAWHISSGTAISLGNSF